MNELAAFANLVTAAASGDVEFKCSCSREARNLRQKFYRLRDLLRDSEVAPAITLVAEKLEFGVKGRYLLVHYNNTEDRISEAANAHSAVPNSD